MYFIRKKDGFQISLFCGHDGINVPAVEDLAIVACRKGDLIPQGFTRGLMAAFVKVAGSHAVSARNVTRALRSSQLRAPVPTMPNRTVSDGGTARGATELRVDS